MLDFSCVFDILISVMSECTIPQYGEPWHPSRKYDFSECQTNKDQMKAQVEDAVYTWLTTLETDSATCMTYQVSDSGPLWDNDNHDITRLCKMLFEKIDYEYKVSN